MGISINQAGIAKQAADIAKRYKEQNDIATFRTLNTVQKRGQAKLARDIKDDTGHKISTAKQAVKAKKATKRRQVVKWHISGRRLQYPSVRVIKRQRKAAGISYLGMGKKRIKALDYIGTGSKAFVIQGQHSSKKIAVFRKKGFKRKVTTFSGHSMPYLMRYDWENQLRQWMKKEMVVEYPKQLQKAKFR